MPMPLRWGHINKRIFNPLELRRGKRPVIRHVGRSSGTTYRTPLDAHAVDGGYIFILVYGSGSDWVQNILAAGTATLEIDGGNVQLTSPRIVDADQAREQFPDLPIPRRPRIDELLQMDRTA